MTGTPFYKMSGSGNDFVVFDARGGVPPGMDDPAMMRRLCARGTGVGADGVVFIEPSDEVLFRMRYHNADGSRSELCGNATLCSARLAVELAIARPGEEFRFHTDSGVTVARIGAGGPEVDLAPVTEVQPDASAVARQPGEQRIGFARAGVPHLVVACGDVDRADVSGRGAELRRHPSLRDGANVDFVSRGAVSPVAAGAAGASTQGAGKGDDWRYRTFERGVEAETLACGTGAVATAVMLAEWGLAGEATSLRTRSGETLLVRLRREGGVWYPSLSGPARLVYEGTLREI